MTYRDLVTGLSITTAMLLPLLGITCANAAQAEAEPPNWYQVEIIIFAHHPRDPETSEQWRDQMDLNYPHNLEVLRRYISPSVQQQQVLESSNIPDQPAYLNGIFNDDQISTPESQPAAPENTDIPTTPDLAAGTTEQAPGTADDDPAIAASAIDLTPIDLTTLPKPLPEPVDLGLEPFILLPQGELQLSALKARIDRALDLRLLTHMAWRQPAYPKDQSAPVFIQSGDQYDLSFEIEGTVTVSENRFLHVQAHLFFSKFIRRLLDDKIDWSSLSNEKTESFMFGDTGMAGAKQSFSVFNQKDIEFDRGLTAEFKHSRRVRNGELHYLDHPLFGMMLMVTPHQLPDPVMEMEEFDTDQFPAKKPVPIISVSPDAATSAP